MTKLLHMLIFLPALVFWIPFSFFFSVANRLTPYHDEYQMWNFCGTIAGDRRKLEKKHG